MAKRLPVNDILDKIGISYNCYKLRLSRGWTHEEALNPKKKNNRAMSHDDLMLVYAMLDERDYHLSEANKLTSKKIAEKMGISESTIIKISIGERYGR